MVGIEEDGVKVFLERKNEGTLRLIRYGWRRKVRIKTEESRMTCF